MRLRPYLLLTLLWLLYFHPLVLHPTQTLYAPYSDFLAEHLPQVKLIEPEATYLLWLDFRALGMSDADLNTLIAQQAKLWLNDGPTFGPGGSGFQRMNIACPRSVLEQALQRLAATITA